jgi:hypothetical protein
MVMRAAIICTPADDGVTARVFQAGGGATAPLDVGYVMRGGCSGGRTRNWILLTSNISATYTTCMITARFSTSSVIMHVV